MWKGSEDFSIANVSEKDIIKVENIQVFTRWERVTIVHEF